MRQSNKIILASMNPDKLREFNTLFAPFAEIEIVPAEGIVRNAEKLAFAEIHNTYLENAVAKARLVYMASHHPALADDSGIEIRALDGKPGVHSRRFGAAQVGGSPRLTAREQDRQNIELVLQQLKGKTGADRQAKFVATLVLLVEGILVHATGELEGTIAEAPRGTEGFGYDPIFIPQGSTQTFAEMTDAEKNAISHRARAVQALMQQVKSRGIVFAKP